MEHKADKPLGLPVGVVSRVDVGRLLRELQALEEFLKQSSIREPGTAVKLPRTSRLMDDFVSANGLNVLHDKDRMRALNFLTVVKSKAPLLHMSFSADPSPLFTQKLITWLRKEIHPLVLLQVGLQPNIGAGCVVRGSSKYFDFSLRQHFIKQRGMLMEKIHGITVPAELPATPPAEVPEEVQLA